MLFDLNIDAELNTGRIGGWACLSFKERLSKILFLLTSSGLTSQFAAAHHDITSVITGATELTSDHIQHISAAWFGQRLINFFFMQWIK